VAPQSHGILSRTPDGPEVLNPPPNSPTTPVEQLQDVDGLFVQDEYQSASEHGHDGIEELEEEETAESDEEEPDELEGEGDEDAASLEDEPVEQASASRVHSVLANAAAELFILRMRHHSAGRELADRADRNLVRLRALLQHVTDLPAGLDQATIEAKTLTMVVTSQAAIESGKSSDTSQRQCMICLGDFAVSDKLRVLPCFHLYHCDCIDKWLSRSAQCPVCKHDICADVTAEASTPTQVTTNVEELD
jgi:Arc/MetJ-type ribon-helix-helix transcriptional regulator